MKAKRAAIYLIKKFSGMTNNKIGESFGVTYSAISKTASVFEKLINKDNKIRKEIDEIISQFKA